MVTVYPWPTGRGKGQGMRARRIRGFTLVELMVTLVIVAILLALAVPNFHTLIENSRQNGVVDSLMTSFNAARNTALSRDITVQVCPVAPPAGPGQPAGTACAGSWGSAANGSAWMVSTQPPAPATSVILSTQVVPGGNNLTISAQGGSTPMLFSGRGLVIGSDMLTVCDARGAAFARAVEVNPTGFVQSSATRGFAPDGTTPLACP